MVAVYVFKVGLKWYYNNADVVEEVTEEAAQSLIDAGTPFINAISEGLGNIGDDLREGLESLGGSIVNIGEGVGAASLDVIENIGISILKAGARTKEYIVDEIGDRRVTFVKQFTILIIVLMTTVFVYNSLMLRDK